MRFAAALVLALIGFPALAQSGSQVKQNGNVTPGHSVMWTSNGTIQDAGSATAGLLTELGVTKNGGCAIGINQGPLSAPFNQMCAGVDSTGGYLNIQNFGGLTSPSFRFIINGTTYPFPGTANNFLLIGGANAAVPIGFGTSLYPFYQNGHQTTATTTTGSNVFTVTDTTYAVPGAQIFGGFGGGVFVQSVVGNIVTADSFIGSPNATSTGTHIIAFGLNRWSTTSAALANNIAGQYGWFGAAAKNSWTPAANYRSFQNDPTQTVVDAQSPNGLTALFGFTRTSDHIPAGLGAAQGMMSMCINDSTPTHRNCWGWYDEAWSMPGDIGVSLGSETTVFNYHGAVSADPYNINPAAGTHLARFDCGLDENGVVVMTAYPCSAGLEVINNGQTLLGPALLIGNGTMDTSVVSNPSAIGLPRNNGVGWYSGVGHRTWSIFAASSSPTVLNNFIELDSTFWRVGDGSGNIYQLFDDEGFGAVDIGLVSGPAAGNYWEISGAPNGSFSSIIVKGTADTAPFGRIATGDTTNPANGYINLNNSAWFYGLSANTSVMTFLGSTTGTPSMSCGGQAITDCSPTIAALGTGAIVLQGPVYVSTLTPNTPVYADGSDHLSSTPPAQPDAVLSATGTVTFQHTVRGLATLSAGSVTITLSGAAVFIGTSTYSCFANDNGAAAVVASVQKLSATQLKIWGTGTDTVDWQCTGS